MSSCVPTDSNTIYWYSAEESMSLSSHFLFHLTTSPLPSTYQQLLQICALTVAFARHSSEVFPTLHCQQLTENQERMTRESWSGFPRRSNCVQTGRLCGGPLPFLVSSWLLPPRGHLEVQRRSSGF